MDPEMEKMSKRNTQVGHLRARFFDTPLAEDSGAQSARGKWDRIYLGVQQRPVSSRGVTNHCDSVASGSEKRLGRPRS